MTTKADVKRLVTPTLERNRNLALVGRLVLITPLRHVVRGVFVDRTGSKEGLNPHWFAGLLGDSRDFLSLSFGSTYFPGQEPRFHTSNPHLEEDLRAALEDFALPTLRPVQTVADF